MAPDCCISYNSASSFPSHPWVKAPIGYNFVAVFCDLLIKNSTSDFESIIGFVFGFTATAVKPLFAATCNPFAMVSLSSKPGSPKETLLSNHPQETCKFFKLITLTLSVALIESAIFLIVPFSIKMSFF